MSFSETVRRQLSPAVAQLIAPRRQDLHNAFAAIATIILGEAIEVQGAADPVVRQMAMAEGVAVLAARSLLGPVHTGNA